MKGTTMLPNCDIRTDVPLKDYTFTRLGGNADYFSTVRSIEDARQTVLFALDRDLPLTVLGNGSNVIVRDGGIRGVVMYTPHLSAITVSGTQITAEGGAPLISVSQKARELGLTGLEFACGIPGSVGGAVVMNAGAYGGEIKDVLTRACVMDENGDIFTVEAADLELGYRTSNIEKNRWIVLSATFDLKPGDPKAIQAEMERLTRLRREKQPLEYPSCGSVFKRPKGHYVGPMIEACGLKGLRIGGAEVSTKHAGFIVNKGGATAKDYLALIDEIKRRVYEKFGVKLETEVRIIGED
ncbi:UDP-N-acetylmuramate dehydrogenase [Caenibacillus caldisaponilyticus]|uniref:UDP-N-acetylmuramate dehydrogenase n=1 Tax=Caenibacillus caldisaponilyticus TaxID=1674942 RepID=UPI001177C2AA|nr:UDP-N-acetylmuramate dehydrogenase [Caenibacillus caldisaponilyticus]